MHHVLQALSNSTYRAVARAVASALGTFDFVQCVYLRRSVAAGEVSFGRSDIDLTIVLRSPLCTTEEAEKILALNKRWRILKTLLPVLGQAEVGTLEELHRSYRADPYRCSIDRRTALFVYGEPIELPDVPITQDDALHWVAIWFAYYLPWALRRGDRRNLRKFALEIWNACAVATGRIAEPFCRRSEVETAWRENSIDPSRIFGECCRIVNRLYDELDRPFQPLLEPLLVPFGRARLLVLPSPDHPLPPEAFVPRTVIGTPQVLDLYIQQINPEVFGKLPPELAGLGFRQPTDDHVLDYRRRLCGDPRLLRRAGFVDNLASSAYTVRMLARAKGKITTEDSVEAAASYAEYYRVWYPRLYRDATEIWRQLDARKKLSC